MEHDDLWWLTFKTLTTIPIWGLFKTYIREHYIWAD